MAWEQPLFKISLISESDLSAAGNQFRAVRAGAAAGNCRALAANTDRAIGILQNTPNIGEVAEILVIGVSKYRAGAAVALDDLLGVQADGDLETLAAGNPTRWWFGYSLDAPGAGAEVGTGMFNFSLPVRALTAN